MRTGTLTASQRSGRRKARWFLGCREAALLQELDSQVKMMSLQAVVGAYLLADVDLGRSYGNTLGLHRCVL